MKLLSIRDTRDWIMVSTPKGDKKQYIPGTGMEHECSLCGQIHEIHAEILKEDGNTIIVGVGCAKKLEGMSSQIKAYEIQEKLNVLVSPLSYTVIKKEKCDSYGRKIFIVKDENGIDSPIHCQDEKEAVLLGLKYLAIKKGCYLELKYYLSEKYRLEKLLNKS